MNNSIWQKAASIDNRILYIIMAIVVAVPLMNPIGFPIVFQQEVLDTVELIRSFPAGTIAYVGAEVAATNAAELRPMMIAIVQLMYELGHKIVIGGFWADGCSLARLWAAPFLDEAGAVYGEDYVILGYRPSSTSILDQARTNFIDAFSDRDIGGLKLSEMPVMKGLEKASDLGYLAIMNPGSPGTATYTTAWRATGEVNVIIDCCTSGMYISSGNNYQAGLTAGLIGGLNGAAQLEQLTNRPYKAIRSMDAQALGHLAVIALLIIGNIGYFQTKREEEAK
ncbi:MAG: hypothetical protein FWF06_04470 [Symbiobacteriaceae bacterium]|nr:hypothetical protein [Symbiobacteriaceae bacterium]